MWNRPSLTQLMEGRDQDGERVHGVITEIEGHSGEVVEGGIDKKG